MALPGWLREEHLTKILPACILQILYLGPERKSQSLPGPKYRPSMAMISTPGKMSLRRKRESQANTLRKAGTRLGHCPAVVRSQILVVPAAHMSLPLHDLAGQSFIHVEQPSPPPFNSSFGPRWFTMSSFHLQ